MDKFFTQKKNSNDLDLETQDAASYQTKKKPRVRAYDEEYIKLGFIACLSDVTKPQCLVCHKTLSNDGMKPANVKRRLMAPHPDFAEKPQSFFERKKKEHLNQKNAFTKSFHTNENLFKASYLVVLRVI